MTVAEKIFIKYEGLADYYAGKIWNEDNLGLEREDIAQELKIRLFLAIKTYARRWNEFKKTGKNRPIPIEFYLKTTMTNKSKDMIKEINSANFVRNSEIGYDRGIETESLTIERTDVKIGSESILDLFYGEQRRILQILILRDFDVEKTKRFYRGKCNVDILINNTLETLRTNLEANITPVNEFEVYTYAEDLQS